MQAFPSRGRLVGCCGISGPPYTKNARYEIISRSCAGFPLRGSWRAVGVVHRAPPTQYTAHGETDEVEERYQIPAAIISQLSTSFPRFAGTFPSRGRLSPSTVPFYHECRPSAPGSERQMTLWYIALGLENSFEFSLYLQHKGPGHSIP